METTKVVTFGCRLNSYESEVIKNILIQQQLENITVFNTCCVTNEAEKQAVQAIRKEKRENPDMEIIVTGCAAQINPRKYATMPEVSRVINNKEKLIAKSYIKDSEAELKIDTPFLCGFENKTRALVPIQNGCDHYCTFCIITHARGSSRSLPLAKIIEQIKIFTDQGYKEVVLTGVNITSYGNDLPDKLNLGQVVKKLLDSNLDLARLRLSSLDVAEIDDDLFQLIISEERFMPHLHLSLQSGDNEILHKMKRRHTREQVQNFCHMVQNKRPTVTFGADIITGFPTETEKQFNNTCDLIKEFKMPYLHVFPYSERKGTVAVRMPQVDKKIRKDRARFLRAIGQQHLDDFSKKFLNTEVDLLIEQNNIGRMKNFLKVSLPSNNLKAGQLAKAKIIDYQKENLIGEIIP